MERSALFRFVQEAKALSPRLVILQSESPVTSSSFSQELNAWAPTVLSVFGTVSAVRPLSPLKAFSGSVVNVALEKSRLFNLEPVSYTHLNRYLIYIIFLEEGHFYKKNSVVKPVIKKFFTANLSY